MNSFCPSFLGRYSLLVLVFFSEYENLNEYSSEFSEFSNTVYTMFYVALYDAYMYCFIHVHFRM